MRTQADYPELKPPLVRGKIFQLSRTGRGATVPGRRGTDGPNRVAALLPCGTYFSAGAAISTTANMLASWAVSSAATGRRCGRGSVFGPAEARRRAASGSSIPWRELPSAASAAGASMDRTAAPASAVSSRPSGEAVARSSRACIWYPGISSRPRPPAHPAVAAHRVSQPAGVWESSRPRARTAGAGGDLRLWREADGRLILRSRRPEEARRTRAHIVGRQGHRAMPPGAPEGWPDVSWQDRAACRGMDMLLFFGPDGEPRPEREIREAKAKAVCASCPVQPNAWTTRSGTRSCTGSGAGLTWRNVRGSAAAGHADRTPRESRSRSSRGTAAGEVVREGAGALARNSTRAREPALGTTGPAGMPQPAMP